MGQTTGFLTKALTATTAIVKRRLVKYGAADGTGVPATDGTAFICGVSDDVGAAVNERCSVFMNGNIADVEYGGNVTRGDPLTADAQLVVRSRRLRRLARTLALSASRR
jgi:hypothetical protein